MYKILIVDDDILTLSVYSRLLILKGYQVSTCNTAVGIFGTIIKYRPDVILMDYQMPAVSGLEAIKQLKSNDHFKFIPVIFFSSVTNLPELAQEAGADGYLSKISSNEELFAIIQEMTDRLHPTQGL